MAHEHCQILLNDRSAVGEARRTAISLAERFGFDAEQRSNIGIVATEACNNALLHGGGGAMLVCAWQKGASIWLDLLTLDSGPGIHDLSEASRDGFSSRGTAGEGLGAISRQSDASAIYSAMNKGTVAWSRFQHGDPGAEPIYGAVSVPLAGETACGDSFAVLPGPARSVYMVIDGLGHGIQASEAAAEGVLTTLQQAAQPAQEILLRAHDALRKTRGAAMSVAVIDHEQKTVTYAGVGNVTAFVQRGLGMRSMVSQNGTVGAVLPRQVQEYTYPFEPGSLLVMFSDGLNSRTTLNGYAGLQNRPPQLVAGVLYRDFSRERDDATVLVTRLEGPPR